MKQNITMAKTIIWAAVYNPSRLGVFILLSFGQVRTSNPKRRLACRSASLRKK